MVKAVAQMTIVTPFPPIPDSVVTRCTRSLLSFLFVVSRVSTVRLATPSITRLRIFAAANAAITMTTARAIRTNTAQCSCGELNIK